MDRAAEIIFDLKKDNMLLMKNRLLKIKELLFEKSSTSTPLSLT